MIVDLIAARRALACVQQWRETIATYCIAGDRAELSVDDALHCITQMYGFPVSYEELEFPATFLKGMVRRYADGRAEVFVRRNLELNDRRFTAIKEASHILIDEEGFFSTDVVSTIDALIFEYAATEGEASENPVQSEVLAEAAAMTLMYPPECHAEDIRRREAGELTVARIASHHGVPEFLVRRSLSDHHQEFLSAVNRAPSED